MKQHLQAVTRCDSTLMVLLPNSSIYHDVRCTFTKGRWAKDLLEVSSEKKSFLGLVYCVPIYHLWQKFSTVTAEAKTSRKLLAKFRLAVSLNCVDTVFEWL